MFEVNATLKDNTTFIPDGYKTEFEAYSLQISMSKNANEGIVAQLSANYYPGYVRGLDSLFQLLETYDEQDGDDNSVYTAGQGISIIGNQINNTGDLSPTNEIQNVMLTGGLQRDASNNFGLINCPTGEVVKNKQV